MRYISWLDEVGEEEFDLVGGKCANLGEMISAGLPVPPGFCLNATAYKDVVEISDSSKIIETILNESTINTPEEVDEKISLVRRLILNQPWPDLMAEEILFAYDVLSRNLGAVGIENAPVAIRSSTTAGDLPTILFAGLPDAYLNVRGKVDLLFYIKCCWASIWSVRALMCRTQPDHEHNNALVPVIIQSMIQSEVSGSLFTANPDNSACHEAVIKASWGLGEVVVSGKVSADTIIVSKEISRILSREIADKALMVEYAVGGGTLQLKTPPNRRRASVLTDRQAVELVDLGSTIEDRFQAPQYIDWAYALGKWYVLHARPMTTLQFKETEYEFK